MIKLSLIQHKRFPFEILQNMNDTAEFNFDYQAKVRKRMLEKKAYP